MTALCVSAGYYPAGGERYMVGGAVAGPGSVACHWSSDVAVATPAYGFSVVITGDSVDALYEHSRGHGFAVRCLQAFTSDLVSHMLAFPFGMT